MVMPVIARISRERNNPDLVPTQKSRKWSPVFIAIPVVDFFKSYDIGML